MWDYSPLRPPIRSTMSLQFAVGILLLAAAAASPVYLSASELDHLLHDPSLERTYLEETTNIVRAVNSSNMASPHYYFDQRLIERISVGNPPQHFRVAIETGTTRMFLFDWSYAGPWRQEIYYDPEKSSTGRNLKRPFLTKTGGLEAKGKTYQDELRWQRLDCTTSQNFGLVNDLDFNGTFPEHGVVGLGWIPQAGKKPSAESSPIFNVLLNREEGSRKYTLLVREHGTPMIVWGPARIRANPPIKLMAWGKGADDIPVVPVAGFRYERVDNSIIARASLDSGFSVIALPAFAYHNVFAIIKPKFDPLLGSYTVDCRQNSVRLATMSFNISGVWYSVRPHHFVLDRDFPDDVCILAITRSDDNCYYLGLPFLRTAAVVYDVEQDTVALAPYKWDMEEPVPPRVGGV